MQLLYEFAKFLNCNLKYLYDETYYKKKFKPNSILLTIEEENNYTNYYIFNNIIYNLDRFNMRKYHDQIKYFIKNNNFIIHYETKMVYKNINRKYKRAKYYKKYYYKNVKKITNYTNIYYIHIESEYSWTNHTYIAYDLIHTNNLIYYNRKDINNCKYYHHTKILKYKIYNYKLIF